MLFEARILGAAARYFSEFGWSLNTATVPKDQFCASEILWHDHSKSLIIRNGIYKLELFYTLDFESIAVVSVLPSSRSLAICKQVPASEPSTLQHILLDQVMPRIVAHDGHLVLHAGLIANECCAIVVCGASGQGKSTLVANLAKSGSLLHGDDAAIVEACNGQFLGRAVYPSLRVRPDTLERLFPEAQEVHAVAHYSDKLRVTLPSGLAQPTAPARLTALLFLTAPAADDRITLRRMRPADACIALIENSFALDPTDRERARHNLKKTSSLADSVPAFELSYPRDYGRLDDVRQTLVDAEILHLPKNRTVSPSQCVRAAPDDLPVPLQLR